MSDASKLKAILKRAAADGVVGARPVAVADVDSAVTMIVDAVDATLLGRRLTLSTGQGRVLSLDAAGRRALRAVAPIPEGLTLDPGAEFTAADAEALAAALRQFCDGAGTLQIDSKAIPDSGDASEGGLSADRLREALKLTAPPVIDAEADLNMEPFIAALSPWCEAALWINDDEVSLVTGDKDTAAMLSQWVAPMLERLLAPEFPLSAGLETDGVFVFVLPELAARHVVIAGRLGAYLVALVQGSDPGQTLAQWQSTRS